MRNGWRADPPQWEELTLFHEEEYLLALQRADQEGRVGKEVREKFHIGTIENPVSPAMWRGSLLATGSSVQAVQLFLEGNLAFNPAGGMHHAYPSRANGFCFINDPAVAINYLKQKGLPQNPLHRLGCPSLRRRAGWLLRR
jgi:acetoin utilization protein AcuC